MTEVPDSVLEKIRKIRELADPDRGATPHEVEAATAKLHKLLLSYNLDLAEITTPQERGVTHELFSTEDETEQWQMKLMAVLAHHHFCRAIHYPNGNTFALIGQRHNVRAVKETFFWLAAHMVEQAIAAREEEAEKEPIEDWFGLSDDTDSIHMAQAQPRLWLLSYLYGMVDGIDQQFYASRRDLERERGTAGKALVPLLHKEVDAYMKEHFQTEKRSVAGKGNPEVVTRGQRAGRNMDLQQRKELS